ncbi:MAG TPA: CerR family C-terminal domain-containing protein [bacterium]|nr:CerR family C-terminal domain-containing protein [bacterium]HPR87688.1 CerR family C-terminal domain-containing protein [bacterium]
MKTERKKSADTRHSLLAAASEIFAEKGYRDATIAAICEKAGANIAAVNYHFGDKQNLYVETWRHCFTESIKAHPPDGGVAENAPAKTRLQGQVTALLQRIADEKNYEFIIVQKERANPTGLLHEVMRRDLRPLQKRMDSVVRDLLGPQVKDDQVFYCVLSIISQCIDPMAVQRGVQSRPGSKEGPPAIADIAAFARHVVAFSLAGMQAIRAAAENNPDTADFSSKA